MEGTWRGHGADGHHVRHVVRPAGGTFSDTQTPPGGPANGLYSNRAVDAQGNAAMLWRRTEGADDRVQVSGYEAAPPQLRSLAMSRSGHVGTALPFSVDAVDVWSPVSSVGWALGNGATASGARVEHAYAASGTYGASVTATDALGNATTGAGTVTIAPAAVPVPAARIDRPHPASAVGPRLSPVRGRMGGRRLAPGRYRLVLRATDTAGNRSALRRVAFRIVAR